MNLLAITYTNIGPFLDTRTINFLAGKYLIKASIGSGKSFLFFDWPLFALYKYSSRNMLNVQSKEGSIGLLFQVGEDYFFVLRQLKSGKAKDSVQSRFFTVSWSRRGKRENDHHQEIILRDYDLHDQLSPHLEEVVFRNDTELQNTIQTLIPPREVLTHTQLLLQDSENIFAMQAAERIEVFKNIFALLSIDEAKEIVADKKREVQTKLKVMADNDMTNSKLQQLLTQAQKEYDDLKKQHILPELASVYDSFFSDIELLWEDLVITNFSLKAIQDEKVQKNGEKLRLMKDELHHSIIVQEEKNKQLHDELQAMQQLENQLSDIEKTIQSKQSALDAIDEKVLADKKAQKQILLQQRNEIENNIDKAALTSILQNHNELLQRLEIQIGKWPQSLTWLSMTIDSLLQAGKGLASDLANKTALIQELQLSYNQLMQELAQYELVEGTSSHKQRKTAIEKEQRLLSESLWERKKYCNLLIEKKSSYEGQIVSRTEQLTKLQEEYQVTSSYRCEKIQADCPFITHIAQKPLTLIQNQQNSLQQEIEGIKEQLVTEKISEQLSSIQDEIKEIEKKQQLLEREPQLVLSDLAQEFQSKKKEIEERVAQYAYQAKITVLIEEQQSLTHDREALLSVLTALDRKTLKQYYESRVQTDHKLQSVDQEILQREKQYEQADALKKEMSILATQYNTLQEALLKLQQKIEQLRTTIENSQTVQVQRDYQEVLGVEQTREALGKKMYTIQELIDEHKAKDLQIQQLKIDEKRITNLYHIFSKELMYVVLEEALPTLFDIINAYLAQVVEYTVAFTLEKTSSDKLELEVSISDQKGTRPIKALSGGQKVILKLVWILAVASYTRVWSLFLDETINNLDRETVGRVADMLTDFVKQHDCKLYVVTHSPQIQEMAIWDDIVAL